jgi:hypothetical protein
MKLYRNIHRSVWQLMGVEQIQNGGRCHGNQGAKNVKDHFFVFQFFSILAISMAMAAILKKSTL